MGALKRNVIIVLACILTYLFGYFLTKMSDNDIGAMEVVLEAVVPQDDTFQLFYLEGTETAFTIAHSVRAQIKGSAKPQEITFKLPLIKDLAALRLDIGENFEQGDVVINGIRFISKDSHKSFDSKMFNSLFKPNKHIKSLNDGHTFKGVKAEISTNRTIYDPGFYVNVDSNEFITIKTKRLTNYPFVISFFVVFVLATFYVSNQNKIKLSTEKTFIVVFLLILILPTVQKELKVITPIKSLEKRELASKPEFSWSTEYARQYETYFNDNFGFRNHLVNWGSNLKTKFFKSSTYPELVAFGKEKWLYYTRLEGRVYRSYSRNNLLPKDTLSLILEKWEKNKANFNENGAVYLLGFWPNKHTIYSEYLPAGAKMQIKNNVSRVEQIKNYMDSVKSKVKFTDVTATLLKQKQDNLLYHKFDSHWNSYGAFIAYQDFFNQNKEALGIEPKTINDFDVIWEDYYQGELIQMLGIGSGGFFKEKNPIFTLKKDEGQIEHLPIDGFPRLTVITRNEKAGNKLRALVFRDSYTNNLVQFFSLHFYEVYYIWGFKEQYVKELQPDVIIDGFVEREIGEHIR